MEYEVDRLATLKRDCMATKIRGCLSKGRRKLYQIFGIVWQSLIEE